MRSGTGLSQVPRVFPTYSFIHHNRKQGANCMQKARGKLYAKKQRANCMQVFLKKQYDGPNGSLFISILLQNSEF